MGSGIRDELIFVLPMFQAMFQTCFKHGGGQAAPCQLQGHSGRRTKEQSVAARESNFLLPMFQGMFQTCFKHRGGETAPRERRRKRREEDEGGRIIQKQAEKEEDSQHHKVLLAHLDLVDQREKEKIANVKAKIAVE